MCLGAGLSSDRRKGLAAQDLTVIEDGRESTSGFENPQNPRVVDVDGNERTRGR